MCERKDYFGIKIHKNNVNNYTGEDLKPHTVGVLCFKSLPIPRN